MSACHSVEGRGRTAAGRAAARPLVEEGRGGVTGPPGRAGEGDQGRGGVDMASMPVSPRARGRKMERNAERKEGNFGIFDEVLPGRSRGYLNLLSEIRESQGTEELGTQTSGESFCI